MGAKLVLVGKQLQAAGAANGVLGFLTTPKTLLIIAGVVAAIAGLVEVIKSVEKAQYEANHAFEIANQKLSETQNEIKSTEENLQSYKNSLKELNDVAEKDRGLAWQQERAEIELNIQSTETYLKLLEQKAKLEAQTAYESKLPTGYTLAGNLNENKYKTEDYFGDYFAPGNSQVQLSMEQAGVITAVYDSEYEALSNIVLALANATDERYRYIEAEDLAQLEGKSTEEQIQIMTDLLGNLGIKLSATTETATQSFAAMDNLANKSGELSTKEKDLAQRYLDLYRNIVILGVATDEQTNSYIQLLARMSAFDLETASTTEKISWLANAFGITASESANLLYATGQLSLIQAQAARDMVQLSNGMWAAKSACKQLDDGTWELKENLDETDDSAEDLSDSLNAYQKSIKQVTDDEKAFVNSLFDMNGNLTKAAQQALTADSAMASYAQKILEAQQAQTQSDYSNLILQIGKVGEAAYVSSNRLQSLIASIPGVTSSTWSAENQESVMRRLFNKQTGKNWKQDAAAYSEWSSNYLLNLSQKKYEERLKELQNQANAISSFVPSTGGGGGSSSTTSQKSPAQIAAEAATKAAKYRLDALQDELDALNDEKSALEDEIQRIQDEVKAEYQAEIDILNDKKEAIQEAYEAWEEDADAVLDRLKAEKDAIQAVIDAIDKEKEQLEAATAYATEYASRQIDEIDARLDELDAREAEINKKYDDELDKLKATNKELDKQIEREKLLQNLASAKNKKKRVYSAQQGYILVDDIAAISKAQAELDKFDRQQKQSLEKQEIENKRKQELLASGVEAERAALEEQKKLWEEYSKKWSSIVSDYEFKQNRLAYIQRYGKAIEQQNWQQRNRTVDQATKEYADIMARLLAEQERMAAKEAEIAAQEAAMDEARIANQKATAAIEKQISDLQDEMVAAQEARTRKQVESLNALADAIEDAQRRVNQAQKDYDSAQEDEGAYDVDKPRVLKQVGGKAPDDAKVGDYIATADGIYHITGGYAGHWKSRRVSGTEGRSDLNNARAAANWLVKNGYLTAGEFGYRSGTTSATPGLHMLGENGPELGVLSRGDGVIPADITRNLMNIGKNPEKFANAAVARNGGDIIMQGVTLAFPNVRDGSDAATFTKNFVNLAHQYAYKR
jgi:chromosome segregation ATPase